MTTIFLSHSSSDNDVTLRIAEWLRRLKYEDVFLDIDKDDGISPGVNWKGRLGEAMRRAQTVVLLISDHWFASAWCQAEHALASISGKSLLPVIVTPPLDGRWQELRESLQSKFGDLQTADLTGDWDAGLARLEKVLDRVRISPEAFPVSLDTPPWKGLASYKVDDAGLFYGRERETLETFEKLRQLAAPAASAKLLVIRGPSGNGKSSLMRAGLWSQLDLRKKEWLPLPSFIPEFSPFREITPAKALAQALAAGDAMRTAARVLDELRANASQTCMTIAAERRANAGAPEASVVLCVDQAEEMLAANPTAQHEFVEMLGVWCTTPGCLAVMTIRSDTWEDAQARHVFDGLAYEEYPLAPMPLALIPETIRGPAKKTKLSIDEALVVRATEDAQTGDALPLLSFTLEKLYRDHGGDRSLDVDKYERLASKTPGGERISPIENSVRLAAEKALGQLTKKEEDALANAFVPGLVDLTDGLAPIRRRARRSDLPEFALPLLDKLKEAKLLKSDLIAGERTFEVAHEALLRRWPLLAERIEEAQPDLRLIQDVERAAADYARSRQSKR